jgi:hypothetical protein
MKGKSAGLLAGTVPDDVIHDWVAALDNNLVDREVGAEEDPDDGHQRDEISPTGV